MTFVSVIYCCLADHFYGNSHNQGLEISKVWGILSTLYGYLLIGYTLHWGILLFDYYACNNSYSCNSFRLQAFLYG